MSLSAEDVRKVAHLARLNMSEQEIQAFSQKLAPIMQFVEQMNTADTSAIEALSHSFNIEQHIRQDLITEVNQRDQFQAIAPEVQAGLYLVPKVIEGE